MRFSAAAARQQLPALLELLSREGLKPGAAHVLYVWEDDALELRLGSIRFRYRDKTLWDWPPWPQGAGGHDPYRGLVLEWFQRLEERVKADENARRLAPLKEELMAAAWAPARVEQWVAAGQEPEAW